MVQQHDPAVARQADQFEATLKAARIPEPLHDGLWDIWVNNGPRAYDLVARLKTVKTKAAPGMQSIELPAALATALTRARSQLGDAQLAQILGGASPVDDVMAQLGGKTATGIGTLNSDQKPPTKRTKEHARASMAALFDEGIQELNQ
jgi:hypothetical protein